MGIFVDFLSIWRTINTIRAKGINMEYVFNPDGIFDTEETVDTQDVCEGVELTDADIQIYEEMLQNKNHRIFVDKFNQDYIIYSKKTQKNGLEKNQQPGLEKVFELRTDSIHVVRLVRWGYGHPVPSSADKLIVMAENLYKKQQKKNKKKYQQALAQKPTPQNPIVR